MNRTNIQNAAPYTRHEVIGRGSYGIVYKGVHNETGISVAIKVLNLDTAEDEVSDIQKEIVLLQSLKSGDAQNVVKYHGSFLNGTRLWIIMDYCEGGSIRTLMKSGRIEEKYIVVIIREVLAALTYIHKSDIIHRDVKAANILVTNDGRVQLCDFGVAAQLAANHFKRNTFVGTPYWMAPEVISEGLSYNFKADIWSLGITIYEIAMGNPPYADQEPMRAIFLIPRSTVPKLEGPSFSSQLKEFVAACLCEKPEDRLSAQELSKMKCIKGASRVPTSILRELISRFDKWRRSGGVRKSLAMGGDLDVDDDFDGQFGLEDDTGNGKDGWDFGTAQQKTSFEVQTPTWEQSADATEDLLKTIRAAGPSGGLPTQERTTKYPSLHTGKASSRFEHPLMKLFGEQNLDDSTGHKASQSMLELSATRAYSNSSAAFGASEPGTPANELISIEMPALNATSLNSASSISLPVLGSDQAQSSRPIHKISPSNYNLKTNSNTNLMPSRQNSFDHFTSSNHKNDHNMLSTPGVNDVSNHQLHDSKSTSSLEDSSAQVHTTNKQLVDAQQAHLVTDSPPVSRPSSPTRLQFPATLSAPSSPSRSLQPAAHSVSTSISSTASVLPKTGYNASLGVSHVHPNNSTPSSADILPRPSISGSSRERSPSNGSIPQFPKQVKKPSNLVLQMPGLLDAADGSYLPPSPLHPMQNDPGMQTMNGTTTYLSTPLSQQVFSTADDPSEAAHIPSTKDKSMINLPSLSALDLEVLTTNNHETVVDELARVVGDMLRQLTHIEDGLGSMADRLSASAVGQTKSPPSETNFAIGGEDLPTLSHG